MVPVVSRLRAGVSVPGELQYRIGGYVGLGRGWGWRLGATCPRGRSGGEWVTGGVSDALGTVCEVYGVGFGLWIEVVG